MVKHLIIDFLSSHEAYDRAVRLWWSTLEELAAEVGQQGDWVQWRPTAFVD